MRGFAATMRIKSKAGAVFLIFLCAASTKAKGWRGIVPLHSTRAQVEQLLGPPTEQTTPYSVIYETPNETVLIYYAKDRPCGIGERYSRWRVAPNLVTNIFITPIPGSALSRLSIDESKYKKLIGRHLPETQYINANIGEAVTVGVNNEVRSINYFPGADDSDLECPGLPKADLTNCEYVPDAFDSLGEMGVEQERPYLDNFFVALIKGKAMAYIIAYGGK